MEKEEGLYHGLASMVWDVIVVGAGLAGIYAALNVSPQLSVLVITKKTTKNCNSYLAQGGIASILSSEDNIDAHIEDTMLAGHYMNDLKRVKVMVEKGPREIQRLINFGVKFDREKNGALILAKEGGHRYRRIVRAGDHTGQVVMDGLLLKLNESKNINLLEYTEVTQLLTNDEGITGVLAVKDNKERLLNARYVVLATGGIGQQYDHTTNDETITGDGFRMAIDAGLSLEEMNKVQFHPTAFYENNNSKQRFLISEALRGEGAVIRDKSGENIMKGVHPLACLAPRDIVVGRMKQIIDKDEYPYCYLDATHLSEDFLEKRFPTIFDYCIKQGYNLSTTYVPVVPCCHYLMGGIPVDECGQTKCQNLYACGEVAYTNVHGYNRLASNSLLECLVYGRSVALSINSKGGANV